MAGTTIDRELTSTRAGRAPFVLATQADDADIRRLLRERPMPGRIMLSLEREPDYFADADWPGTDKQTIIASEGGFVVCVGSCAIRERFVNGHPCRAGYLGGLRLAARATGRFDILRRGYEFFRELQADKRVAFYFTSIAADNVRAQKFLERRLPGMPAYEFIGDFVTVLLSVDDRSSIRVAPEAETPDPGELLDCLDKHGRDYQFAARWSEREMAAFPSPSLKADDFCVVREAGRISACAALWDQRAFKQTVIRGYAPWLAMARPVVNFAARILGGPRLPMAGSTLAHSFVSPLAVEPGKPDALIALVAKLRMFATGRGIEFLTLGFAANDPRLAMLRRKFRCREYRSRIYVVRWQGLGGSASELDGRRLGPDVALL